MSAAEIEQLGTKQKFWYYLGERKLLYKIGYDNSGEHWAEKIACEICTALRIPHAHYELAVYNDTIGVISETFVPSGYRLILGNELLAIFNKYDMYKKYKQKDYTLLSVLAVMKIHGLKTPFRFRRTKGIKNALSVFLGYLMLDALIANQDRHHENWGLVLNPKQGLYLAPTYDHASSFARNVSDKEKEERMRTRDERRSINSFVLKAKSPFYHSVDGTQLSTFDAFISASKRDPDAASEWLNRLRKIPSKIFRELFEMIPDELISQVTRKFSLQMLEINKERLLSLIG